MNTKSVHFISKVLALAMILSVAVTMLIVPASAAEADTPMPYSHIFICKDYSGSFDKAWEKTYTGSPSDGSSSAVMSITYGYNTFLINEDYCWASCNSYAHYASVHNGNGSHDGPWASPGKVSKKEVTHNGTRVSYYCYIN